MNSDKSKFIIFIIIIISLIVRIPQFYFMSDQKIPGDDASLYLKCAENLSEGKGYYINFFKFHSKDPKHTVENLEKYGVKDFLEWIPPLYISILSLLFKLLNPSNKILFVVIFNTILFLIFLLIFYKKLIKSNIFNKNITLITIFLISINPLLVFNSVNTIMEMLYLIISTLLFFKHLDIIKNNTLSKKDYIIYSILMTALIFTKYVGFVFVIGFFIHFLYKKRIKEFIILGFITFILISPWFIFRDYYYSGRIASTLSHSLNWAFNQTSHTGTIESISPFADKIYYDLFRPFYRIFTQYLSSKMFLFLLPFAFLKLVRHRKYTNLYYETSLILFISSVFIYTLILHPVPRYQINLLVIIIPVSISSLKDIINKFSIKKYLFYIIIIVVSFIYLFKTTEYIKLVKNNKKIVDRNVEAIKKIKINNIKENNKTIATNLGWLHYIVNNPVVVIPSNLKEKSIDKFISMYNIGYIITAKNSNPVSTRKIVNFDFSKIKNLKLSDKNKLFNIYSVHK